MGKAEIRPLATPHVMYMITSWISTVLQNFIQIGWRVSFMRMRDFAHQIVCPPPSKTDQRGPPSPPPTDKSPRRSGVNFLCCV